MPHFSVNIWTLCIFATFALRGLKGCRKCTNVYMWGKQLCADNFSNNIATLIKFIIWHENCSFYKFLWKLWTYQQRNINIWWGWTIFILWICRFVASSWHKPKNQRMLALSIISNINFNATCSNINKYVYSCQQKHTIFFLYSYKLYYFFLKNQPTLTDYKTML